MKRSQSSKGFTLIEVMAVLVIMAIAAAAVIPTFNAYMRHIEQNARNANAKTIFMGFQDVLTSQKATGQFDPKYNGKVDLASITPSINEEEKNNNSDNIHYLVLNKNDGNKQNNDLYKLLDTRIESTLLQNTILVEYNIKTGLVLSTFYTDVVNTLGYDNSSGYNVTNRSPQNLKDNRVGYYAVETTSLVEENPVFADSIISIADYIGEETGNNIHGGNNYGLLTVECILPENPTNYDYTITLHAESGNNVPIYIKGKDAGADEIDINQISGTQNLLFAMGNPFEVSIAGQVRKIPMYIDKTTGKQILVLVIDSVYNDVDIRDNFPEIVNENISASINIRAGSFSTVQFSDSHHAYYDSEAIVNNKQNYYVASIRHLKNLEKDKNYIQTKDIFCHKIDKEIIDHFDPLCNGGAFIGTYTGKHDGKVYKIYDLTMTVNKNNASPENKGLNAGLFASTDEYAEISFVYLDYTDEYLELFEKASAANKKNFYINGGIAGGVVGSNKGYAGVVHCTVTGRITGETAGGVVGENTAFIDYCAVMANIYGEKFAGGVAGTSISKIVACEVGTASELKNNKPTVTGTPYLGANSDEYYSNANNKKNYFKNSYKPTSKNNVFEIVGTKDGAIIGGMVGKGSRLGEDRSEISYSVNAAKITSKENNVIAGGIIGDSDGSVVYCYNSGDVEAKGTVGGITGDNKHNITFSYNTGYINVKVTKANSSIDTITPLNTGAVSGGISGKSSGEVNGAYNMQYAGSKPYSGSFGLVTNADKIEGCYVLLNKHNTSSQVNLDGTLTNLSSVTGIDQAGLKKIKFDERLSDINDTIFSYAYPSIHSTAEDEALELRPLGPNMHRTPWVNPEVYNIPVPEPEPPAPDPIPTQNATISVRKEGTNIETSMFFDGEGIILQMTNDTGATIHTIPITATAKKQLLNNAASPADYKTGKATPIKINNIDVYCVTHDQSESEAKDYTHRFIYSVTQQQVNNPKSIQSFIYDIDDKTLEKPLAQTAIIPLP